MPVYRRQSGLIVDTQFRDFFNATKSVLQKINNLLSPTSVSVDQLEILVARLDDICCTMFADCWQRLIKRIYKFTR